MNRNVGIIIFFVSMAGGFLLPSVFADIIHLKNGNKVEGMVVSENENKITLQFSGGTIDFSRSEIERIEKRLPPELKQMQPEKRVIASPGRGSRRSVPIRSVPQLIDELKSAFPVERYLTFDPTAVLKWIAFYVLFLLIVKFIVTKMGQPIPVLTAAIFPVIAYAELLVLMIALGAGLPAFIFIMASFFSIPVSLPVGAFLSGICGVMGVAVSIWIYLLLGVKILHISKKQSFLLLGLMNIVILIGTAAINISNIQTLVEIFSRLQLT